MKILAALVLTVGMAYGATETTPTEPELIIDLIYDSICPVEYTWPHSMDTTPGTLGSAWCYDI